MKIKALLAAAIAAAAIGGAALAQNVGGATALTSLVGSFALPVINAGPLTAVLPLNGGTFTCSASAATISNKNVNAGSLVVMTLKTVGGTVAEPYVTTITPATGFTVTCGGSDTSTYNYIILG